MTCPSIELAPVGEQLARGRWISPSPAGYEYTHDLIRATVYDQIPRSRRRRLHELAAVALARREPGNLPDRARTASTAPDTASRPPSATGGPLSSTSRPSRYARRSTPTPAPSSSSRNRHDALASRSRWHSRRHARASTTTNGSARRWRSPRHWLASWATTPRCLRTTLIAGLAAGRTGDPDASARLLSEARELAESMGDERHRRTATYLLADLRAQQGQWQAAEAAWLPVLEYARRTGDLTLVGCVLRGLAIAAKQMGDPQAAVRLLEESVATLRECGDRVNELYTSSNLLGVLYNLEAWDRLLVHADEMWPIAEMFGDPVTVGIIRHQQGLAALALGDQSTARTMMAAAKDAFGLAGTRPRLVGLVVNTIGLVAEDEGHDAEAELLYREALDTAVIHDAATESAYARHDLGALLARTIAPPTPFPCCAWPPVRGPSTATHCCGRRARPTSVSRCSPPEGRSRRPRRSRMRGSRWSAPGRRRASSRRAGSGRSRGCSSGWAARRTLAPRWRRAGQLDRQALAISDAGLRRQFFERVPVNRAIVEAHQREVGRDQPPGRAGEARRTARPDAAQRRAGGGALDVARARQRRDRRQGRTTTPSAGAPDGGGRRRWCRTDRRRPCRCAGRQPANDPAGHRAPPRLAGPVADPPTSSARQSVGCARPPVRPANVADPSR